MTDDDRARTAREILIAFVIWFAFAVGTLSIASCVLGCEARADADIAAQLGLLNTRLTNIDASTNVNDPWPPRFDAAARFVKTFGIWIVLALPFAFYTLPKYLWHRTADAKAWLLRRMNGHAKVDATTPRE